MQKAAFRDSRTTHLFSFLTISILPVLVCIIMLGANNLATYKRQLDTSVMDGMHQFTNNYLIYMEIMDACAEHMDGRIEDGMSKMEIPAQLSSYEYNYPQIASIFYFEKTSNCIFTSEGEMPYADFERRMQADYNIKLTEMAFYSNLCQTHVDDTLVSGKSGDDEDIRYLFYMKVMPRLDSSPKRVLVFMLPVQSVIGRLDEYVPGGYSVYSYSDRYLSYLVQQSDGYVTDKLQNKLDALPLDNLAHTQIGWEKYVLLRVRSGVDGMYHMIAYRESVLYQDAYQSIIKSFLPVLLILIITATAAFLMHRYFYNGVERILALPFPGGNETQFSDPYSYIETNTKRVLNQNSQLVTDIRRHNVMQLLKGLLHGDMEEMQYVAGVPESESFRSIMPYAQFTAVYLRGTELDNAHGDDYTFEDMPQFRCAFWMISVCGGTSAAVLINHDQMAADMLMRNCGYFLNDNGVESQSVGLGLTQDWPDMVQVSLMQAQVAAQAGEGMHMYAVGAQNANLDDMMPIAEQRRICQSILAGDEENAVAAFDALLKKLQNVTLDNRISHEWYLYMLESLLGTLREGLKTNIASEWDVDQMILLYAGRRDDRFREFIRRLACEVRAGREQKCGARQSAIAGYVAEHILDPDISPEKVMAAFSVSESAVISAIKESTGMTFAKYVNHLKMEHVCAQLRQTSRPIKEIIAEAGYMDVSNFTRKFRLQYGCTPSIYREGAQM